MNEKFFALPPEKQRRILNAGYHVFGANSYKKSPVSEIAAEAGISKALLFHYFKNKRELYLYLWEEAARLTRDSTASIALQDNYHFFDILEAGMFVKLRIMNQYPDLANFTVQAFYEKDPEVAGDIAQNCFDLVNEFNQQLVASLNPDDYRPGLDLQMMYREIYWASDGCMRNLLQTRPLNPEAMETEFSRLLAFWKSVYLK